MSIRDTIRKHAKPRIAKMSLNGSEVYVCALSGLGRAKYTAMVATDKDNGGIRPEKIAAMGLCEADGSLAYDIDNQEDLAELASLDGAFLEAISLKLFEISGLTSNAVDDAAKKSEASPNVDSGSSSPATSSIVR